MNLLQQSSLAWKEITEYQYVFTYGYKKDSFIFIIRSTPQNEAKLNFLCCSIFKESERNYETNQRTRTLLKMERLHIPSNTSVILFDKLNASQ